MLTHNTAVKTRVRSRKIYPPRVRDFAPGDELAVVEIFDMVGWPATVNDRPTDVRLVASVDGIVAAHAGLTLLPLWGCLGCDECDGTRHARRGARVNIDCVAVHPDFRRLGLAKDLLRAARLVARRNGLPWLELHVDHDNTAAQALYKAMGFRPSDDPFFFVHPNQVRLHCRA